MLRRPVFWIVFTALSLAATVFTVRNFSTAFPLVSIDLQMDRGEALRQARLLVEQNAWPPAASDQAAEFSGDQELQNFIELEGGGKQELGRILRDKIFALYNWRVRHFKEGDTHETLVRFTPDGRPNGFAVKLPDQEKGPGLPAEDALRIAEETARTTWNIDLSRYERVESSKDDRPGGRTDHTFVYERQDERIREGRYRLRLVVAGDRLSELTHFVQIPEAFSRRYEQMRSANDAINVASSVAVFGIYIFGFCGIGLFFMIRHHWALWRKPAVWAAFIALLMGLQQLNSWPLAWMNYDTALPARDFAIRQILLAVALFGGMGILLIISFVAAETLSRRAFPHHLQLWKVWARPVSSSPPVLGQTLAGYLLVAPFFAYEIVLYFFAQEKLGWWTPSDTLVNPDIFASYLPSLSTIAMALNAGFWEECLFRAVPLAVAAIIGERLGKRRAFIAAAVIIQALVFAAGHAGYANQPSYARVVELIIPSFAFAFLYLAFGLLPGIVLHFAYDTVWMALPLFVASGARARVEQAIVIVAVLVPVWVVLVSRIRAGKWTEVPFDAWNAAWKPPEVVEVPHTAPAPVEAPTVMASSVSRVLPLAGLAGLILWFFATPFRTDAPALNITRAEAERQARFALSSRGVEIDSSWKVLSHIEGQPGPINRFVWQTAGKEVYHRLLGRYVAAPLWLVRFARFEGDVAERAEEYQVEVLPAGAARVSHTLPEAKAERSLSEMDARALAVSALYPPAPFREISAQAAKRPARTDWTFTFKDTTDYSLVQGEPRISIELAGDEIADRVPHVYVPEEWVRNERARRNLPAILEIACTVVIVGIAIAGAVIGAVHWSRKRPFSVRAFLAVFGTVYVAGAINLVNNWPVIAAQASTAQPLALQVGIGVIASLVFGIFTAAGLALAAGLVMGDSQPSSRTSVRNEVVTAVCAGLAIAGVTALARLAAPSMSPLWGNYGPATTWLPFVSAALGPVGGFFTQSLILLLVLYGLRFKPHAYAFWLVVGLALAGASIETIPSWLIIGLATGTALLLAHRFVFRHRPELAIITTATLAMLSLTRDAILHVHPAAIAGAAAGAVFIAIGAWIWFRSTITV
jgi:hypothetical protein